MANPYETAGRIKKAWALEHSLVQRWEATPREAREGRSLAAMVETWGDAEWKDAAIKAGTHEPSEDTRQLVVRGLHLREQEYDPFVGLPGAA